jgi:hypothetical protein
MAASIRAGICGAIPTNGKISEIIPGNQVQVTHVFGRSSKSQFTVMMVTPRNLFRAHPMNLFQMREAATYSRTQNENGSYNTRCLDCFMTIASSVECERDLDFLESRHICPEKTLAALMEMDKAEAPATNH